MAAVLAVAEHRNGSLRDVSSELVTAGGNLAEDLSGELHMVIVGDETDRFADQLGRDPVTTIHTVEYDGEFNHDVYVQAITQLCEVIEPAVLMMPNTVNGLDYAPAVAERIDVPFLPDAVDLTWNDGLTVIREQHGGKLETTYDVDAEPVAVTVRPTEWTPAARPATPTIEPFTPDIEEAAIRSSVTGFEEVAGGDVDIAEAEFLVSIGRGIEEEENLELIEELVEVTGATLSSSRPIVDNGWLPKNRQVGQSGKQVTPDVYLAIGISGAVQHVAGMKGSETIVAVNTDPNAPIFDIADYGVVGDLFDVVPKLIEQFGSQSR